MQSMDIIRQWQIMQLKFAINSITYIVRSISVEDARTYRDNGDGWTVLEVLGHLRDYEALFIERTELTLTQDQPDLPNPDPDAYARDHQYSAGDLEEFLDTWQRLRKALISRYETLTDDQWDLAGMHPKRGHFTLDDQLLLTVWHDMNHIDQMTKILLEKKR